ncbi:uncharacterized protein TNCV_3211941 [Trichonephila clavipes]|uniref:Uncharacterized protein n=1 Tax=Trichonephila clavipes TaxID=2585209 RepID=A0A8X6RX91_TRICX|nr:uncharacterized protein TNCV_3211941 [Trichonephila clavipes]
MRQARHLPQRWYWSIVLQVRDVIRQFTQGTPNCNTNPKATVFGIPKEPVLESSELITSRLTGAAHSCLPSTEKHGAKGHATGTPDSTFPRYGSPHTANMRENVDVVKLWERKRHLSTDKNQGKTDLQLLMEFIKNEVDSEFRVKIARELFHPDKVNNKKNVNQYSESKAVVSTACEMLMSE